MYWQKLKEPLFLAVAGSCVLFALLLTFQIRTIAEVKTELAYLKAAVAPPSGEFQEAFSATESLLTSNDFASAFDMLLVASRISPSDPRLLDLVMKFVEQGKDSEDEDVIAMVEDLLDRGDSLVHFQSPSNVQSSRERLTELRASISPAQPIVQSPFDSVRSLLTVSANPEVPLDVRSSAAEQARISLDDTLLTLAMPSQEAAADLHSEEITQLKSRIEQAESKCISESFQQSKSRAEGWLNAATTLCTNCDAIPPEAVYDFSKELAGAIAQGLDQAQEIMPYVKSGEVGATELSTTIERKVESLQQQRDWLYNKQSLQLIREIESNEEWTAL